MAYATSQDVKDYTGLSSLPDDIDRLISRAEELIDWVSLNRIDTDDADHMEAAKKATCAQIEYWLNIGEDADIINMPGNFKIGSFQMGMTSQPEQFAKLAPRARRHLFLAGLLYRGVGMK